MVQVGGKFFSTVVRMMNRFGRVSLCGAISEYNEKDNEIDDSVQGKGITLGQAVSLYLIFLIICAYLQ